MSSARSATCRRDRRDSGNTTASSAAAWNASVQENRDRLREIIAVDTRLPSRLERFETTNIRRLWPRRIATVFLQVRWPVLDGVWAEGLYVEPAKGAPTATSWSSPMPVKRRSKSSASRLGCRQRQFGRILANSSCELLIPTLVGREPIQTSDAQLAKSQQTWREWLHRQAFHMGRHVIGYEVQKVLAAVDSWSRRGAAAKVGVVGYAEGGLVAFYAAAIDPRIDAALVSGFDRRGRVWEELIDRNVWSLLERFSDAEIASLVLPRYLVVGMPRCHRSRAARGRGRRRMGVRSSRVRPIPAAAGFPTPSLVIGPGDRPVGPVSTEGHGAFAVAGLPLDCGTVSGGA